MGVYIKGMEMPKEGEWISVNISPDGKCFIQSWCGKNFNFAEKLIAVPIPPHGRLGDLDKQDVQIEALIERHLHGYTKSTWDFICELRDILKHNPTVIPKESAEEEKNDE